MIWHFANIFNQNLAKRWKDIALRFVLPINFFFSVSKSGLRWLLKVVTTGRKYSWVYFCNACWKILMNHVIRHKLCKTFNVPFGKPIFSGICLQISIKMSILLMYNGSRSLILLLSYSRVMLFYKYVSLLLLYQQMYEHMTAILSNIWFPKGEGQSCQHLIPSVCNTWGSVEKQCYQLWAVVKNDIQKN